MIIWRNLSEKLPNLEAKQKQIADSLAVIRGNRKYYSNEKFASNFLYTRPMILLIKIKIDEVSIRLKSSTS